MVCKGSVFLDDFSGVENGFGNKEFEWIGDFASLGANVSWLQPVAFRILWSLML